MHRKLLMGEVLHFLHRPWRKTAQDRHSFVLVAFFLFGSIDVMPAGHNRVAAVTVRKERLCWMSPKSIRKS
jgi:hypothetical protein